MQRESTGKPIGGRRAAAVAVCACMLLGAGGVAVSSAQLESRIADGESQISRLAASVEAKSSELTLAQAEAIESAADLDELRARLAGGEAREARLRERAERARQRLDEVAQRFERAEDALAKRLVAIYKSPAIDAMEILLRADGFDDLTTRAELLDRIRSADTALVTKVRELRAEYEQVHSELASARDRLAAHNADLADAARRADTVRAAAERTASSLAAARSAQRGSLDELRAQVAAWTERLQREQQLSAAEATEQARRTFGDWVIPESIVMCESGGNYGALNPSSGAGGAYQIMPSTWELYGGRGKPHEASKAEQDRIAAKIYADSGSSPWVCAG